MREQRRFWAWDDYNYIVKEVTGLSCAPMNPTLWWVPSLGYTMEEGKHLFAKYSDALHAAFNAKREKINNLQAQIDRLKAL
jgi:hypothetical protein